VGSFGGVGREIDEVLLILSLQANFVPTFSILSFLILFLFFSFLFFSYSILIPFHLSPHLPPLPSSLVLIPPSSLLLNLILLTLSSSSS